MDNYSGSTHYEVGSKPGFCAGQFYGTHELYKCKETRFLILLMYLIISEHARHKRETIKII